MSWTSATRIAAVVLLAASIATAPASAAPSAAAAPDLLAAMQRDLGLTADQARARVERDQRASHAANALQDRLGPAFAGAWLDRTGLVVAVTDAQSAAIVRAVGAQPRTVARSAAELDAIKSTLDRAADRVPPAVVGWYADLESNSVVVAVQPGAQAKASDFVRGAGVDQRAVRVVFSAESPRPLHDVRGGDAYYINGSSRCSIGFSVRGGFVTAGHCGTAGSTTAGFNRVAQGTVQGATFPGNDYGWVATNSDWTPVGVVNDGKGGVVKVAGSTESAVGAAICRSGSTTGWHCGVVQNKNVSISYPQGTVNGLTQTNVCAEPGDSGGSWLSGDQAQGMTSGGSGNCTSGGTVYFQPLRPALSTYGLTLITSDGDPGKPCDNLQPWDSSTSYVPGVVVQHNGSKWTSTFWSTGAEPGHPNSWAVWRNDGACTG